MIIPIRCMNCGNILADKWLYYQKEVKARRAGKEGSILYMDGKNMKQDELTSTPEYQVLQELGLIRYCCRKHMLTHVDLLDKI